ILQLLSLLFFLTRNPCIPFIFFVPVAALRQTEYEVYIVDEIFALWDLAPSSFGNITQDILSVLRMAHLPFFSEIVKFVESSVLVVEPECDSSLSRKYVFLDGCEHTVGKEHHFQSAFLCSFLILDASIIFSQTKQQREGRQAGKSVSRGVKKGMQKMLQMMIRGEGEGRPGVRKKTQVQNDEPAEESASSRRRREK
ncbi:hypothetical protein OS493_028577, partial [Desmophyllum pertusum]